MEYNVAQGRHILMMIMCTVYRVCVCVSTEWNIEWESVQSQNMNKYVQYWLVFFFDVIVGQVQKNRTFSISFAGLPIDLFWLDFVRFLFFHFFQHHFLCSYFSYIWFFCWFLLIPIRFFNLFTFGVCLLCASVWLQRWLLPLILLVLFLFFLVWLFLHSVLHILWVIVCLCCEQWIQTCRRLTSYTVLIIQYTSSYTICILFTVEGATEIKYEY